MTDLLLDSLEVAVPLAIEEVRHWTPERRLRYCHANAQVIAEQADVLLFGGGEKGQPAQVFTVLAFALACLAFQPGGVRDFAGRRWDASGPSSKS